MYLFIYLFIEDRKASLLIIMNSIIELEVKQNHDNINEWRQEITQFNVTNNRCIITLIIIFIYRIFNFLFQWSSSVQYTFIH